MSVTLTDQNKLTLRTAAYGAVSMLAAASASPHKAATEGSIALYSATGPIGHVLAAKSKDIKLEGKSVAELADQVFPALAAAMSLLERQDPTEADNFRSAVLVAIDATTRNDQGPAVAELARKITAALDAA